MHLSSVLALFLSLGASALRIRSGIDNLTELNKVLAANHQVIIEFFASKCPACEATEKELQDLLGHTDTLVVSVNIDESSDIPDAYEVRSAPVLVFVKDRKELSRVQGDTNSDTILGHLEALEQQ